MSNLKRFSVKSLKTVAEHPEGPFVTFKDYQKLEKAHEETLSVLAKCKTLLKKQKGDKDV